MSFASDPLLPKKTFDMGTGARASSRSASSAGTSVAIDENEW